MISGNNLSSLAETRAAVADHYDALDPFYRGVWGEHIHHGLWLTGEEDKDEAVETLCRLILEKLQIKKAEKVCDVGCGYGALARMLAHECGANVTALTVSKEQWNYARERAAGDSRLIFLLRDWLVNDLPDECFDKIVALESSEHMVDKDRCFAEMRRVLRHGGQFAVAAWLSREDPGKIESRYLLRPICVEGRLPSLGSASDYRKFLEKAGFGTICFQDLTDGVRKTWGVCIRRLVAGVLTDRSLAKRFFARDFPNRVFAVAILRLWLAYRTGSMRYGLFWGSK